MNTYLRIIFYAVLIGVPANFCVAMDLIGMSVTYDKKDLACAICQERKEGIKTMFPCLHLFHTECALPWVRRANTCPVCRAEISTDEEFKKERNEHIEEKKQLNDAMVALYSHNNDLIGVASQLAFERDSWGNKCVALDKEFGRLQLKTDNLHAENNKLKEENNKKDEMFQLSIEHSVNLHKDIEELKKRHLFDGFIIPAISLIVPWVINRDISREGLIAKGCMSVGIYCLLTPHTISPKMGFFSLEGIKRIVGFTLVAANIPILHKLPVFKIFPANRILSVVTVGAGTEFLSRLPKGSEEMANDSKYIDLRGSLFLTVVLGASMVELLNSWH